MTSKLISREVFLEELFEELINSDDELMLVRGGIQKDITCGSGCGLGCGGGCGNGCSGC